jgi:hypothetical protein
MKNKPDYVVQNVENGKYDSFLRDYQTSVSGPKIEVQDLSPFKQSSLSKANHQFQKKAEEIRSQMEDLIKEFSDNEKIWESEMSFEPYSGCEVYLYQRESGSNFCSMISPSEWGDKFIFLGKFKLDSDSTWRRQKF